MNLHIDLETYSKDLINFIFILQFHSVFLLKALKGKSKGTSNP